MSESGGFWGSDSADVGLEDECPNGLLPDGETCPRCGKKRAPSGIDGGTWVHLPEKEND